MRSKMNIDLLENSKSIIQISVNTLTHNEIIDINNNINTVYINTLTYVESQTLETNLQPTISNIPIYTLAVGS